MLKLNVKLDIQAARKELFGIQKEVNKGAARAMDRVATTVTKEAADEISGRLNLKKSTIKGQIRKTRPYGNDKLIRDIDATGSPVPLRDFQARATTRGATYKVKRGGARKIYKRNMRTGFILNKFGGHVFVRTGPNPPGPKDAPIKKVYGPSVTHYFMSRINRTRMERVAGERWPIEFEREMKYRRSKIS